MDKLAHGFLCFWLTLMVGGISVLCGAPRAFTLCAGIPVFLGGLWKEWTDPRRGGQRELLDVVANAVGIALATGVLWAMF